jgi:hypothetical protein
MPPTNPLTLLSATGWRRRVRRPRALTDAVMAQVFRISAYRAEHRQEVAIVLWAKI